MYIQYVDIPEFGWKAMDLDKAPPDPYIRSLHAYDDQDRELEIDAPVDLKQPVTLRWNIFAAQHCRLEGIGTFDPIGNTVVYPEGSRVKYTIHPIPANGLSRQRFVCRYPGRVCSQLTAIFGLYESNRLGSP